MKERRIYCPRCMALGQDDRVAVPMVLTTLEGCETPTFQYICGRCGFCEIHERPLSRS